MIQIPAKVFLPQLARLLELLTAGDRNFTIAIDISRVEFLIPAALVAILARCDSWSRQGKKVILRGARQCANLAYLQRIDFLRLWSADLPETFTRHPAAGRFIPIVSLDLASGTVDTIATEISRCVFPDLSWDDDTFQAVQYAAGELLSNAKYHSGGKAFACAQFFPSRSTIQIAIADNGRGIRASFFNTSKEHEADSADAAIRLALQPGVSSALLRSTALYGTQNHRGVGLSVNRILAREAGGRLLIASENGWFDEERGLAVEAPLRNTMFPGTLVCLTLHRDQIANYAGMHAEAMAEMEMGGGPLDTDDMFLD